MTNRKRPIKVFLCHDSDDKPQVYELYKRLKTEGIDVWLDQEKLLPGQDWEVEVPKAVREADVVIVCLVNNTITKEGHVQREIKLALDIAEEKPEGTIFIIPARLENCKVPEQLSSRQSVDLFNDGGYELLLKSLNKRAKTINVAQLKKGENAHSYFITQNNKSQKEATNETATESSLQISVRAEKGKGQESIKKIKLSIEFWAAILGAIATIIAALIGIGPALLSLKNTPVPVLPTPFCMSSEDILVKVHVLQSDDTEIETLAPGDTFYIEPNSKVYFQVEVTSVNGLALPSPLCAWTNTGASTDGRLLHNNGCKIDYQGGTKNITDSISVQLSQPSCIALPPYPFFIKPQD